MDDILKIKNLIYDQKFEEAKVLLKKIAINKSLSDPATIEDVFTVLISANSVLRYFLKFLKISKVPQTPIDTIYDTGRRFFYSLYIINRFGGERIVSTYVENLKVSRALEYRFLGGIHYFNMDYEKAKMAYSKAIDLLPESFDEFRHLFIYGNLAVCYIYLDQIDEYETFKKTAQLQTNNHPSIERIFAKYDVFKLIHQKKYEEAIEQYHYCKSKNFYETTINSNEKIYIQTYISAIREDLEKFRENLKNLVTNFRDNIKNGNFTPERLIGIITYIETFTIHHKNLWEDIINIEQTTYPYPPIRIRGLSRNNESFNSFGNPTSSNYINLETEEYEINGDKGIGLSNELKSIYWIVRAHEFGISFETLASLIYDDTDFAGLFLIRERVKQIINRLNTRYKLNLKISLHRVYIEKKDLDRIYIQSAGKLKIKNNFTIYEFMSFYEISQSKAQKTLNKFIEKGELTKKLESKKNIYSFK